MKTEIHEVETKVSTKLMGISKNRESIEEINKKSISTGTILKELEEKSCYLDEDVCLLKTNIENMKMNSAMLRREIEDM